MPRPHLRSRQGPEREGRRDIKPTGTNRTEWKFGHVRETLSLSLSLSLFLHRCVCGSSEVGRFFTRSGKIGICHQTSGITNNGNGHVDSEPMHCVFLRHRLVILPPPPPLNRMLNPVAELGKCVMCAQLWRNVNPIILGVKVA